MTTNWLKDMKQLMILHTTLLLPVPVKAGNGSHHIILTDVFFIGGFMMFIVIVIGYHCFLRKQRRRQVMEKILSEEYDYGGFNEIEAAFKDLDVSASVNMTKVNVREKDAVMKRFNVMFHVKGTPV